MRRFFLLVPLVLLCLSARFFASPLQPKSEVQLGCQTPMFSYTGQGQNPFATLAPALGKHPNVSRFRVSWLDTLGSGWDKGTLLYNRKSGTLKYYDIGGAGEAHQEYYRKSDLFTGLNDRAIHSLVQRYDNLAHIHQLFPFSFLQTLPKLGYHRTKLDDFKRSF